MTTRRALALTLACALGAALVPAAVAAPSVPATAQAGFDRVSRQLVVGYRADASERKIAALQERHGLRPLRSVMPGTELVETPAGTSLESAIAALQASPLVAYAEPNFVYHSTSLPNDPRIDEQWALRNVGQIVNGRSGEGDADIDAPSAWTVTKGAGVTVAIVDTGVAYEHPELAPNIWKNRDEVPGNGFDDDGNGFVDDVRGWDFVENDATPRDLNGHGTHVAGIAGAEANNSLSIAGVSHDAEIMPLRALDHAGAGTSADIASAFTYAATNGARVVNASFGGPNDSQTISDAISRASDVLFVVAAGNESSDNDTVPSYPCSSSAPNRVCVAATDSSDRLVSFSNYGDETVHLGAPGSAILSTEPKIVRPINDGFEVALDGRWKTGGVNNTWGRALESDYFLADSPRGDYISGTNSWAQKVSAVDLSGLFGCRLNYWLRLDTEARLDGLLVEASTDESSWDEIASWSGSTEGAWAPRSESLSGFQGGRAYIRFRFTSSLLGSGAGADIDDLEIRCVGNNYTGDEVTFQAGTSMAAPQVSGVAALLWSHMPNVGVGEVAAAIIEGTDPVSSLDGKTISGGRLNAAGALEALDPALIDIGSGTPGAVTRKVGLRLRRHLVARGRVSSEAAGCVEGVTVKIFRWGKPIKKTITEFDGRYKVRLKDRRGKYRAQVPKFAQGATLECAAARSVTRRHSH